MPPSKLLIVSSRARKANAAAGSLMPGIALIRYRLFFSFFIVGIRSFRQVYCLINGKKWVGSFSDISSVPYQLLFILQTTNKTVKQDQIDQ